MKKEHCLVYIALKADILEHYYRVLVRDSQVRILKTTRESRDLKVRVRKNDICHLKLCG